MIQSTVGKGMKFFSFILKIKISLFEILSFSPKCQFPTKLDNCFWVFAMFVILINVFLDQQSFGRRNITSDKHLYRIIQVKMNISLQRSFCHCFNIYRACHQCISNTRRGMAFDRKRESPRTTGQSSNLFGIGIFFLKTVNRRNFF